jgi:peptidyl-tRNA hydrolase
MDTADDTTPWAMQIVLRMEKNAPQSRAHLCSAAAVAVVRLLTSPEAGPDGAWRSHIDTWTNSRIRKHARRARGAAWNACQQLDGVTAVVAGASARAFVPTPVTKIPESLKKLQLSGSEPEQIGPRHIDSRLDGPLIVSISTDPWLSLGKAAAAAGHAAQIALYKMPEDRRSVWAAAGYPVVVEHPQPKDWAQVQADSNVQVVDAGFTEIVPGTVTAVARW